MPAPCPACCRRPASAAPASSGSCLHRSAVWHVCDGKDSRRLPSACRVVTGCNARVRAQVNHLVELGVNAVELLPVFEYDELEFQRSRNPRDHMVNVWGYSHLSFFAPMARFASDGAGPAAAAREFKELVRALHGAGIEVILDVVYNHTAEGAPPAGAAACPAGRQAEG